ncbi:protein SENESCENCE-ASSOCIATED GENE 21, mitochondrial-like [Oryza brachyantha]|nr:protein SENESCENCE-ASSOCIATED GENE 21, mitochondrial-like [Oryza brachyantha]
MARVVSSCVFMLAQRRGMSAAITTVEGSAKIIEDKAVKLGTVAKDVTTAMATTTEEKTAFWEPDPETGYYRPVTGTKEVDAADLRAEMIKQRMLHD